MEDDPMTAVIPTGSRQTILRDLTQRRDKAMDLLYTAEADGDERRWRKATARFWLRELQLDYIDRTPSDGACPTCLWGTEAWPVQGLFDAPALWSCLEHWSDALEREAVQMAQAARWMGAADVGDDD